MLTIRLQRVGRKHEPAYRVVVVDSREKPQSGKAIDRIGFYNPALKQKKIDADKARQWISHGAQCSDTVHNLLVSEGIIEGAKINVLPKNKNRKEAEPPQEPAPASAEATADKPEQEVAPVAEEVAQEETPAPAEETPAE